jgi:spore coat protein A
MLNRRDFLKLAAATGAGALVPWRSLMLGTPLDQYVPGALASTQITQTMLLGRTIPKYMDWLPHFANNRVTGPDITVEMHEFDQQVLPAAMYPVGTAGTRVWGYKVGGMGPLYPGYTVEAVKGTPTTMRYYNMLPSGSLVQKLLTVDQTLHWANPDNLPMMVIDPMDPTRMIPNPARMLPYQGPPPAVVHMHGAEVPSEYDGGPDQWFTPDGIHGAGYRSDPNVGSPPSSAAFYTYPNEQEATTLWFHDHTLGATRLNVYAGLAAFYLLRDGRDTGLVTNPIGLPAGPYEIEIVIQDRMFDTNGQWFFPDAPALNPEHPLWIPEFLGDTIVVNGKTWPYLNVEPCRYRFRFLNGSNARFYRMWLENKVTATPGPAFWQIGSDGGLLNAPVKIDPADPIVPMFLLMAPGERCDLIIDFTNFAGQTLTLRNNARAPFPKGTAVDPQTVGQIMQFRVGATATNPPVYDPANPAMPLLRAAPIDVLPAPTVTRQLTLNEVMGMPQKVGNTAYPGGPLEVLVNNSKWAGERPDGTAIPDSYCWPVGTRNVEDAPPEVNYITEQPLLGETEQWEIINLTADAHPIHLHLVQFHLLNRQNFNVNKYTKAYNAAFPGGGVDPMTGQPYAAGVFMPAYGPPLLYGTPSTPDGAVGGNPPIGRWLQGPARPPEPNEVGWKDTVVMYPGQVTRIRVRFATQDGNSFPFDATSGPGYVWHCHIVDHEDNEMMRPYNPVETAGSPCPVSAAGEGDNHHVYLPFVANGE